MTLLLLILLFSVLVFFFYYEFLWKKVEKKHGKSLVSMAHEFFLKDKEPAAIAVSSNWDDWRYRLSVELHRSDQLDAKRASEILNVPQDTVERYLDQLESEGRVQQVGDAERGIYYKAADY